MPVILIELGTKTPVRSQCF